MTVLLKVGGLDKKKKENGIDDKVSYPKCILNSCNISSPCLLLT